MPPLIVMLMFLFPIPVSKTMAHLELTPASRTRVVLWRAELAFLKRCRGLKRPPKTVRMPSKYLRGARSGVGNGRLQSFLKKVSDLESARLELAIVEKSNKIREFSRLIHEAISSSEINFDLIDFKVVDAKRAGLTRRYAGLVKEINTNFAHWPAKLRPQQVSGNQHEVNGSGANPSPRTVKNRRRRLCRESNRCKREAAEGLNSGTVINLTDEELPPEVVAVLMKRSGFVPTNKYDSLKGRVDCYNAMSKLAVKTKRKLAPNTDEVNSQVDGESPVESLPPSLYRRKVGFPPTTNDHVVDSVVADVQELVCALNPLINAVTSLLLSSRVLPVFND